MSFSENLFQDIEDYLNDSMNAEEIVAFESQINTNPDLAEALEINKKMRLQYGEDNWDFIKDDKDNKAINELESILKSKEFKHKKEAIQNASELFFKNVEPKKANDSKSKLYFVLAIAASLIVFLGLFFGNNSQTNLEIYSDYNNWEELPSLVSRGDTNTSLLTTGENAFVNKNYKLASETFNAYNNSNDGFNVNAFLYLGVSQLELENYTEALKDFQKIIDSKTMDQSKGYWYKALTYLKMDDRENAIAQLDIIASSNKNFKFEEAKVLLEKLN